MKHTTTIILSALILTSCLETDWPTDAEIETVRRATIALRDTPDRGGVRHICTAVAIGPRRFATVYHCADSRPIIWYATFASYMANLPPMRAERHECAKLRQSPSAVQDGWCTYTTEQELAEYLPVGSLCDGPAIQVGHPDWRGWDVVTHAEVQRERHWWTASGPRFLGHGASGSPLVCAQSELRVVGVLMTNQGQSAPVEGAE